jgi:ATP-dependent Clp protease protease subunit
MNDDPGQQLDHELYRSLYESRTILLGEPLEDRNSNRICNALLVLAAEDPRAEIRLLINSPGGSVPGMLAIRDCMRAIPNDVRTVNLGMAYSAGQFLLSSGTRGKRSAMTHSKVLLHQGSAGIGGTAMDIAIQADDLRRTRDTVLACIAEDTGQSVEQVEEDSRRDRWFTAGEALDYGFIDAIVSSLDDVMPARRTSIGLSAAVTGQAEGRSA